MNLLWKFENTMYTSRGHKYSFPKSSELDPRRTAGDTNVVLGLQRIPLEHILNEKTILGTEYLE